MSNKKDHRTQYKKQLNEYSSPLGPGHLTGASLKNIWSDVKDAFSLIGSVLKDITSSVVYLFKIFITVDKEKREKIKSDFASRKKKLTSEIDSKLQRVRNNMGPDFFPYVFLTRPVEYMAYMLETNPYLASSISGFLEDIGVGVKKDDSYFGSTKGSIKDTIRKITISKEAELSKEEIRALRSMLEKSLNEKCKISSGSSTLEGVNLIRGMIKEDRSIQDFQSDLESAIQSSKKQIEDLIRDLDPKEIVGPSSFEDLMNLKKEELRTYVDVLNSPASFIAAIGNAKSLGDIRDALKLLSKTPYKIEGLGPEEEQKIIQQAKSLMKEIKEKGKTSEFLKAAGKDASSEKDEDLLEAAIEVITKNSISSLVEMFKNPEKSPEGRKFLEIEKELKKDFIEEFTSDVNQDALKFLKQSGSEGQEAAKIIEDGVSLIQSSGLLGLKL